MSFAYVTLLTNDHYLPGALVLLKSIKNTQSSYPVIALICGDQVSEKAKQLCHEHFDRVIYGPMIKSNDFQGLALLGRRELDVTFSKIHVFNPELFPYSRVAFIDADVLVKQSIDAMFTFLDASEVVFAASPDIGWPDCFNSGVFVTKPDKELYTRIVNHSLTHGSFDGGDQGLLNSFFDDWAFSTSKNTARLPFVYNVTPTAFYSYAPALNYFRNAIKAVHFVGYSKPWKWSRFSNGSIIPKGETSQEMLQLVTDWWTVFDQHHIEDLMRGFTLDRDWNLYQGPNQQQNPGHPSEEKYLEFAHYRANWNPEDVRVVIRRNSQLSVRSRSRSPEKRRDSTSSRRSASPAKPSPVDIHENSAAHTVSIQVLEPIYPTANEYMSRMEPKAEPPANLENYHVGWDPKEMRGLKKSLKNRHVTFQDTISLEED